MPKTGRSLIGTVAGFKSEWWPVFDRNGGRLHVGIRTIARMFSLVDGSEGTPDPAHFAMDPCCRCTVWLHVRNDVLGV